MLRFLISDCYCRL